MADIKIIDNTPLFQSALERAIYDALEEIGDKAEKYAKELAPFITGRLCNSITFAIEGGEKAVYIGTNVEYAPYVELGTSKQAAQPYLRPAAANHGPEYRRIMETALKSAK